MNSQCKIYVKTAKSMHLTLTLTLIMTNKLRCDDDMPSITD